MDRQGKSETRHHRRQAGQGSIVRRRLQVRVVDAGRVEDLLPAHAERVGKVGLEADRTGLGHALELLGRAAGADQTPQPKVDVRLAARQGGLGFQDPGTVNRGDRVRHVENDGHAAGGSRGGQRAEVLFLWKSWVAAVDVHVDRTGQDVLATRIHLRAF